MEQKLFYKKGLKKNTKQNKMNLMVQMSDPKYKGRRMERMNTLRRGCCRLLLVVLCIALLPLCASAQQEKIIRVGLYNRDDYQVIRDKERHSGYNYEYLLEIAKYTGWTYEFVEGTWQECVAMLECGEIDLLGGMQQGHGNTLLYADTPSAYASNCLLVDSRSNRYTYEDYEAFDGMRIGILSGSDLSENLRTLSQEHGFSYTPVPYDTEAALDAALRRGEIDSIGLTDFRNLSNYKIIARFNDVALYYAASSEHPEIINELNHALEQIHEQDRFYENTLYDKYFNAAPLAAFTKEELDYIRNHGSVRVALFQDIPLVCQYNVAAQTYEGLMVEILSELSVRTGLTFELVGLPPEVLPWDFLNDNPNTLLAPLFQNSLIHYKDQMRFFNTIVPGKMFAVSQGQDESLLGKPFVLAVPEGMYGATEELGKMFPNGRLVKCASHQDGMNMVRRGTADMTLVNEVIGTYLLQSPYYEDLTVIYLNTVVEDLTMGTGTHTDPLLMSILNKTITSFTQRDMQQLVMGYLSAHPYELSVWEWLYRYRIAAIVLAVIAPAAAYTLHTHRKRKKTFQAQRIRLQIAEEKLKAEQEYKRKLYQQANFDALTGLYNQSCFVETVNRIMQKEPEKAYVFFYINLSRFKLINEMYGAQYGDTVLLEVARRLREKVGDEGIYARLYADQFVICYPLSGMRIDEIAHAKTVFHFAADGKTLRIQANVGVYINDQPVADAQQAITYARIALQNAVESTDTHVHFYKDAYLDRQLKNQMITNDMEHALQTGEFVIYLQPQYDIRSQRPVGAEALARWFHPTHGLIPPNEFIPVFEANRFIFQLDMFICEEVCKLLNHQAAGGKRLPISVNLSRVDLQNPKLLPTLKALVQKYNVPTEYLHLEITESAYADDNGKLSRVTESLRQAGFQIEMDDFGSGYSSLNMLKDIQVDVLKLDMKFFDEQTHMDRGESIIRSVVQLAHSLGMPVVAEGVETEQEANFLRSIHCLIVQGYLYGRPMPVADFEKLLEKSEIGPKCLQAEDGSVDA